MYDWIDKLSVIPTLSLSEQMEVIEKLIKDGSRMVHPNLIDCGSIGQIQFF